MFHFCIYRTVEMLSLSKIMYRTYVLVPGRQCCGSGLVMGRIEFRPPNTDQTRSGSYLIKYNSPFIVMLQRFLYFQINEFMKFLTKNELFC
jgi:hypothetical protein